MRAPILSPILSRSLALILALAAAPVAAEDLRIGLLSLVDDARYVQDWGYARVVTPPPVDTRQAAAMALKDLEFVTTAVGLVVSLDAQAAPAGGVVAVAEQMAAAGDQVLILDLPAADVAAVAAALADLPVVVINATAPEDSLRACQGNLLHSGPSLRMQMDSFAQYLRAMNWTTILLLVGADPADAGLAAAFVTSAERLRLEVVAQRSFTLAADPQQREANNIKLLTGDADYDVVFVADTRGEFGRYVPYATQLPRPVIGSVGLTALPWHWAMERDGATQVSSRFDKATGGRKMSGQDWAVWIAVKSAVTAAAKRPGATAAERLAYLRSDKLKLDGSKGVTLTYRGWDGQLRMPMLLATDSAVIAIAPLEGYLHATNTLDTLGADEAESLCK